MGKLDVATGLATIPAPLYTVESEGRRITHRLLQSQKNIFKNPSFITEYTIN